MARTTIGIRVSTLRAVAVISGEVNVRVPATGPAVEAAANTRYVVPSITNATSATPVSASDTTAVTRYVELSVYVVSGAGVVDTIAGLIVSRSSERFVDVDAERPRT